MLELKHEDLSVFDAQRAPSPHEPQASPEEEEAAPPRKRPPREWRNLRRVFGLPPPEPDYAGKDAVEVLGVLDAEELAHLTRHEPDYVDCAMARLVRLISGRFKEGGLTMPPPIVSRIYQELSNGSMGFHQAHKIARVPFPFPYAQLLSIMKIYFILTVPLAVVCFISEPAFATFMSGFTSATFVCLNEVR